VLAENGAGFDVIDAVFLFDDGALGAFTAAVRTESKDVHAGFLHV
jgi:hypothetical protein